MKKNRLIFYAVFAAFHLFIVFFSIFIDTNKNDLGFLSRIHGWIFLMKYGAFFGLILLIIDMIWAYGSNRELNRENEILSGEISSLKAKLFDLQEAARQTIASRPPNPDPPA